VQDCFSLALERNPELRAGEADLAVSRATFAGQRGRREPSLIASWAWRTQQPLARPIQIGGGVIRSSGERTTSRELAVTLNQTLYERGLRESIRLAGQQVTVTAYSLEDTRRRLLLEVAAAFYTIFADQELVSVAQAAVTAAEQHLELVDARIEEGTGAPADRLPVEAELAEARFEALRTANATEQAMADLRALLALAVGSPLNLDGQLVVSFELAELADWLAEAFVQRPDLAAQRTRVTAARVSRRQAEMGAGLSLSLTGQAEYGRYSGTDGETWWLGAGASYPLYDRTSQADLEGAQARLQGVQERLADLELAVAQDVERAWYAVSDSEERLQAADVAVAAAQLNLDAARERYAEGVANIIEVTDAELAWRRAQGSRVQARFDRNLAHYQLLGAAGRPLIED